MKTTSDRELLVAIIKAAERYFSGYLPMGHKVKEFERLINALDKARDSVSRDNREGVQDVST